jgi:hypothetical protein
MSANIKASVDGTQAIIGVGGVDQMTVSNAGVVTANSFVGAINNTNITATGSDTARTLANRFADAVNVKDFGAVGDYTTDDTTAINEAIASLPTTGGTVFFPNGRYRTTATITINKINVILVGNGCGNFSNSLFLESLNNVAVCGPSGATQIIGDFVTGSVIRVKKRGFSIRDITIDSSSNAVGGNAPISTGIQGRKGGGGINSHGIELMSDDIAGESVIRFNIRNVSVYNQPTDGIICIDNIVASRIDFVEITCCNRHSINIQSGRYIGRTNITKPGQIQLNNIVASRCGGHGLLAGGTHEINISDAPYRIEIHNYESYLNLIVPANAMNPVVPSNCYLSGENHVMIDSAFDGSTRFGLIYDDPYVPIYVRGRNIDIFNFRSIGGSPYAAYVGQHNIIGTWGINFHNFYTANEVNPGISYDPAIYIENSNCRGVRATADLAMGQVVNLTNKVLNSNYEDSYAGTTTTDIKQTFIDDVIADKIYSSSNRSTISPVEISINNNEAFYIQFNQGTRGLACVSGNLSAAKSGMFHFRCGDGSAFAEAIASSATNVAVTTGPLTGTTGSVGNLTFSVDLALNRIYIENRTGSLKAFAFSFLNLTQNSVINSYSLI